MIGDDDWRSATAQEIRQVARGVWKVKMHDVGSQAPKLGRHARTQWRREVAPKLRNSDDLNAFQVFLDSLEGAARDENSNIDVPCQPGAEHAHVLLDSASRGWIEVLEDVNHPHAAAPRPAITIL